jgi:hypothetical protein
MQHLRKYRRAAFRKPGQQSIPASERFGPKMAQEWQRLVHERNWSKSEHTPLQRHEIDPGD